MGNVCSCGCGCTNPVNEPELGELMRLDETICDYCQNPDHQNQQTADNDDPHTILQKRFARGEISKEGYLDSRDTLDS